MRYLPLALSVLAGTLLAGCPRQQNINQDVAPRIAISATRGDAPHTVVLSAEESTSVNGGPLTYEWSLGDGTTSTESQLTHTFTDPGRYVVSLRATDPTGETGVASVDVRVAGTGAVAIIGAEPTSGASPLRVEFDGTLSQVPDDTILNYFWDFGDGETSRLPQPTHTFRNAGQYEVELKIETAGGLDATTTTTITTTDVDASLQFVGSAFAKLPVSGSPAFNDFTFELWARPDSEGGSIATLGSAAVTLEVEPSSNTLRMRINGETTEATVTSFTERWRHVAVVYEAGGSPAGGNIDEGTEDEGDTGDGEADEDADSGDETGVAVLYLDGNPIASTRISGSITIGQIVLGNGFRGNIGEVRLWSSARSVTEIASTLNRQISVGTNLLGNWRLDEGSGQVLDDRNNLAGDGTLGDSTAVETADPAWSTLGPPLQ